MTTIEQFEQFNNEVSGLLDMLDPVVASKKLTELSVIYSSINSEAAERDHAYRLKFKAILDAQSKRMVGIAKAEAEATDEYYELIKILNVRKSCEELIRALKFFIKANQNDWEFQRNT